MAQVFREYGLVICGWSGEWDKALLEALGKTKSPWFSTYWSSRSEPGSVATSLLDDRSGRVISHMDADQLFRRLADTIAGLEGISRPELVSAAIARSTMKQYLVDPTKRIRLHELVTGEVLRVRKALDDWPKEAHREPITKESVLARLTAYEQLTETLRSLMAIGCYWGALEHHDLWVTVLTRLFDLPFLRGAYYAEWAELQYYPALMAMYSAGIACVATNRYETLSAILNQPRRPTRHDGKLELIVNVVHPGIARPTVESAMGYNNQHGHIAVSHHFSKTTGLWEGLREVISTDEEFDAAFDRFEYFLGLVVFDHKTSIGWNAWGPVGMFQYHGLGFNFGLPQRISEEINTAGTAWPPLQAGLFGGSLDRLNATKEGYDRQIIL